MFGLFCLKSFVRAKLLQSVDRSKLDQNTNQKVAQNFMEPFKFLKPQTLNVKNYDKFFELKANSNCFKGFYILSKILLQCVNVYCLLFMYNTNFYIRQDWKFKKLIIKLPREVEVFKSQYIYTVWDFAIELGSWVGVLFGYCFLDLVGAIMDLFAQSSTIKQLWT